jgi:hypothetical protein
MNLKTLLPLLALAGLTPVRAFSADERIWLHVTVNGEPANFAFDTGSSRAALWPESLEKFRLKLITEPTNEFSGIEAGRTDTCRLTVDGAPLKTSLVVLAPPKGIVFDFDGFIGWNDLKRNIMSINAIFGSVTFLPEVPKQAERWLCLSLATNSVVLALQIPVEGGSNRVLFVDTGKGSGVTLPSADWRKWKQSHPQAPTTFEAVYSPDSGARAAEIVWADRVSIGPLVLTNVPLENGPAELGSHYAGTLGLAALKGLNFIVDGKNGRAYISPWKHQVRSYPHNRLGAVFLPAAAHTNQLVARVAEASPASEAGIRDGDVLVRIGDRSVEGGMSSNAAGTFSKPAGEKMKLTLSRDGKTFTTTATLRDILKPTTSETK